MKTNETAGGTEWVGFGEGATYATLHEALGSSISLRSVPSYWRVLGSIEVLSESIHGATRLALTGSPFVPCDLQRLESIAPSH